MIEDDALTRRILACCYTVHRELGPGYTETTYQRAVTRELERANLRFSREEWLPVFYQGEEIDRVHVDFLIDKVLLEVRAKHSVDREDVSAAFACLKSSNLPRGLLVNFGAEELQVKRLSTMPRL